MIADLKPYPAMKDSGVEWLGEVPEHWETSRLGYCSELIVPMRDKPDHLDGEVPWVRIEDFSGQHLTGSKTGQGVSSETIRAMNLKVFPKGTVLCSCSCSMGATAIAATPLVSNQTFIGIAPKRSLESEYAYWLMQVSKEHLTRLATGAIQQYLSRSDFSSLRIILPPLPEQAAIVRYLDHVDRRVRRLVRAKRKLITLLTEQKQAIIHRAVTRGLDPDVPLKDSGVEWLGEVPEHWEVWRAKYFYREVDERSVSGSEELMSVSHKTGVTPRKKSVTMFLAENNVGHKICRPGDLAINTMWAYMAALGVARQIGIVSPSYGVYRPIDPEILNPDFIDCLLRTEGYKLEYLCRSTGITSSRLRLYPDAFLRIPILCPPGPEQAAIVHYIHEATSEVQTGISQTEREIKLLREYRTRLISDVVTGKLDVREAAANLPDEPDEPEPLEGADDLMNIGEEMANDFNSIPEEAEA